MTPTITSLIIGVDSIVPLNDSTFYNSNHILPKYISISLVATSVRVILLSPNKCGASINLYRARDAFRQEAFRGGRG